jgi:hypothetical protein
MGYAAALFAAFVISGIAPFSVGHLEAQEIPEGLDEGLFEIRASHLPALTSLVLITPRGAVLLPLTSVLELTGIPFERTPSGALLSLSRPAGIGTAVQRNGGADPRTARSEYSSPMRRPKGWR